MKHRWSSVCRGATLWGLEHPNTGMTMESLSAPQAPLSAETPTVTSRLSRYSYGMSFDEEYNQKKHLLQELYRDDATGLVMAKKQMTWLLRRVKAYLTCPY